MELSSAPIVAGPSTSALGREARVGDNVWVRDGKHEVWGKAEIPAEVADVLRDAGTVSI